MLFLLCEAGEWPPDSGMKVTSFCSRGLIVTVMRGKVGVFSRPGYPAEFRRDAPVPLLLGQPAQLEELEVQVDAVVLV